MRLIGTLRAANGAGCNNHSTAVPFDIPDEAPRLYLVSDTDGVLFAIGGGTGDGFDTFAADANSAPLYDAKDANVTEGFPVPKLGRSPQDGAVGWQSAHGYVVGDRVTGSDGNLYQCSHAGTSAALGTGPAGATNQVDGTVTWTWRGKSGAKAIPDKTVARVAIWNPTAVNPVNVKVYVD